jgi:hypothetical protein
MKPAIHDHGGSSGLVVRRAGEAETARTRHEMQRVGTDRARRERRRIDAGGHDIQAAVEHDHTGVGIDGAGPVGSGFGRDLKGRRTDGDLRRLREVDVALKEGQGSGGVDRAIEGSREWHVAGCAEHGHEQRAVDVDADIARRRHRGAGAEDLPAAGEGQRQQRADDRQAAPPARPVHEQSVAAHLVGPLFARCSVPEQPAQFTPKPYFTQSVSVCRAGPGLRRRP